MDMATATDPETNKITKNRNFLLLAALAIVVIITLALAINFNNSPSKQRINAAEQIRKNQLPQAEISLRNALSQDEKTFGVNHPNLATDLIQLAAVYNKEGKSQEAEKTYKRARDIQQKAMKPQLLELTRSLTGLGNSYAEQGKYDQAESVLQQSLAIREDNLPAGHSDIAETETLYKRAMNIYENTPEASPRQLANLLRNYADLLSSQGRQSEANAMVQRASTLVAVNVVNK